MITTFQQINFFAIAFLEHFDTQSKALHNQSTFRLLPLCRRCHAFHCSAVDCLHHYILVFRLVDCTMIGQFFILSPRGDTIINKDFRGDAIPGQQDLFFRKVIIGHLECY